MTKEEAIKNLEMIRVAFVEPVTKEQRKLIDDTFDMAIKALEQEPKWIPIKKRPLTHKEKEEFADLGYSEDSITFMYDCPLPEDGEEVLITALYDKVKTDTFCRDEGCHFEFYYDEDDVKAWMPLPKPYKAESEDKNE